MKRRILRRIAAKRDLIEHFAHIGERNLDAARQFRASAERAFKLLAEMPDVGVVKRLRNASYGELRMWSIREFPDRLIFYRFDESTIEIVRVLHARQDYRRIFAIE